ncbi:hypothetical protein [Aestuariicoccus sp. MJ-SS9]|uniref:hypothetical protein n=1 Tax=Aestuariicoccus sp. MJ-SS9 TaxID=3079855 RepID=UPI0029142335|nr:hypothetical protein [Aestuariicoccus sp. MJ-SS9]MDU8911754.1 hypothetical protein [Aestuariicoccus sp. MJ-SS9]
MTRGLHLHVGLPKCGSTAIQRVLAERRRALRDRGVDYPRLIDRPIGNLTPYVLAQRPAETQSLFRMNNPRVDLAATGDALRAALDGSGAPQMILSSEALSHPLYPVRLDWMFARFDEVQVHLFLRPRPDWVLSHFSQRIRTGGFQGDLDALVNAEDTSDGLRRMLRYSDHVAFWERCAGPGTVRLHFLGERFGPPARQFLDAIGCADLAGETGQLRANEGLTAFELCVLSHLPRRDQRGFLAKSHKVRAIAARFDPAPGAALLTDALRQRIEDMTGDDTARLLAMQDRITAGDMAPATPDARPQTSFGDLTASAAFADCVAALKAEGLWQPP